MGRLAFMPVVLVVATVDDSAVFVRAVPDFCSKIAAALTTFDFAGENAHTAVSATYLLSPRHLGLHHLEHGRLDDGRVTLLHEVAGDLSRVLHRLLGEEVRRESLLDYRTTRVLLVGKDPVDGSGVPFALARDRQYPVLGQFLDDSAGSKLLDEQPEDELHGFGLLFVDGEIAVLPLVVAEETGVAHGEFAVCHLFSDAPSDILRNTPRLLLAKRRENC